MQRSRAAVEGEGDGAEQTSREKEMKQRGRRWRPEEREEREGRFCNFN